MSPEYILQVSKGKTKQFEAGLGKGVSIIYKEGDFKDSLGQLDKQLEAHKYLVSELGNASQKDNDTQRRISAGYRQLFRDLFTERSGMDWEVIQNHRDEWKTYFGSPYDQAQYDEHSARAALINIFLRCTKTGPTYLFFDMDEPWRGTDILSPRDVRVIVEYYGLRDGHPKDNDYLAAFLGVEIIRPSGKKRDIGKYLTPIFLKLGENADGLRKIIMTPNRGEGSEGVAEAVRVVEPTEATQPSPHDGRSPELEALMQKLPQRVYNAIARHGVKSIDELRGYMSGKNPEILKWRNFWKKSFEVIKRELDTLPFTDK